MVPQTHESEVLTRREAAAFLRISPRSFDKARKEGRIRACQVGPGRIVFRLEELRRFLRETEGAGILPDRRAAGSRKRVMDGQV